MNNEEKIKQMLDCRHCRCSFIGNCTQTYDDSCAKFKEYYNVATWKDDKAVELYAQELRQFRNLLIKINPDAKDLINIEQSINDFRNALNQ